MEKSGFGSSVLSSKSRFGLSSGRRSGILNSSRRQSLKLNLSGKASQTNQVIFRSHLHVVESFGTTLPVLVREALTFTDKNVAVSVQISNDGWAWFVCGRRLLIWQCKQLSEDGRRRVTNSQCRELTLPSSDLAYRAELVVVFTPVGGQVPSCIAVSPEGLIRYWPSITHEGSSIEMNADLQGQECDSLTDISPLGCILATTTATVVLVQPQMTGGRHSIACRPLKLPHGWLGGISKLIPSLIFGSLQSSHIMETKLVKVTAVRNPAYEGCEWVLYVLAGHTLQKWVLIKGELERLIFECDVNRFAVDAFQKTIGEHCGGNPNEIQVWFLDMQPSEGGIAILLGATITQISPQFYYALGTLTTDTVTQPSRFDKFCPLNNTGFYRETDEPDLTSYKFLLTGTTAFLYKSKALVAVSATNYGEESDKIEFFSQNDEILGAALCRGIPIFFSKEHGIISVTNSDISRHDLSIMSASDIAIADHSTTSLISEQVNLPVTDMELEEMSLSKDSITQMKAAFLYYIRRNSETAEGIVNSLFPYEEEPAMDVDAPLDVIVSRVCMDLINDIPAGDPRWAPIRRSEISISSSSSLQILNQLEDKQRAVEWFFSFLRETKLWERLGGITVRETVMATTSVLSEYSEKIVAAITLKNLHSRYGNLIEQCIKSVVGSEKAEHGLTCQDLFYREVSRVHECLRALTQWSDDIVHSEKRPQEIAYGISDANSVLLAVLQEAIEWRKKKKDYFATRGPFVSKSCEYLPWTAAPGSEGLRDSLTLQHSLTLKYGARAVGELELKTRFYENLVIISDIILDGRRSHLESLKGKAKYEAMLHQYEHSRTSIIKPFLVDEEYERAAILAEKYLDFHILIQICEMTDNIERLDNYCEKYADENFSRYLFNWYIRERKPGRLLQQFRSRSKPQRQKRDLSQFLGDHPSLSWINNIFTYQFKQASNTLHTLAKEETELISRKKTMLSLAKLSLLASNETDHTEESKLNELDSELELVAHQEDLPEKVLEAYGYDVSKLGVLTAAELIKLYICEENEYATEVDFKKALDLLDYVEDDLERNELRHSIWCQAILRDSWTEIDSDSPSENILNLLFFKLADIVEFMGGSPEEFLPPLEYILQAPELGALKEDRHFQYLIRVGYEHFLKTSNCGDLSMN
ncbi:UNVERIFIED_CONTAM: hypothetical protein PYX00_006935 [Menopon gallinae]|uniref:Nuclear pore complex protein Nup133 n=1 Tax=Menopon gallinae TaxID=328185 RepID=A0AAW2HH37_9NEOP